MRAQSPDGCSSCGFVPPSPATACPQCGRALSTAGATAYATRLPPAGVVSLASARPTSLGTRFLALVIDVLVCFVPLWLLGFLVVTFVHNSAVWLLVDLVALALLAASFILLTVPLGSIGQTIGRRTMGVRVVDHRTGGPIGWGQAVVRQLVWVLMGVPCYLGHLSYFTDRSGFNRGFHDQAAGSLAVAVPRVGFPRAVRDVLASLRR